MSYRSPHTTFYIDSYEFDIVSRTAIFRYSFDRTRHFEETVSFASASKSINERLLDKTLQLAHVLLGISYYKTFPTADIVVESFALSDQQAAYFSEVYRDGLSQYVYENQLAPSDIAQFKSTGQTPQPVDVYDGEGIVAMQSGGKDSLLLAELLKRHGHDFTTAYVSSGQTHPAVIDTIGAAGHRDIYRQIDRAALATTAQEEGLNGHVPITSLLVSLLLIDMVLHNEATLLLAIGQEGEEPYEMIGDYAIRHQWSKTWQAEQSLAHYVVTELSPRLQVGSPLRGYTELKITELFSQYCWERYHADFSSCNVANYLQGQANETLTWCGECAKCANSFLLFAPFITPNELIETFGHNLFVSPLLTDIYKGLLGIDGAVKPFECVGETDELRLAYKLARERFPEAGYELPFTVPSSEFDYERSGPVQPWAQAMIQ